jgi:hypothetical protein
MRSEDRANHRFAFLGTNGKVDGGLDATRGCGPGGSPTERGKWLRRRSTVVSILLATTAPVTSPTTAGIWPSQPIAMAATVPPNASKATSVTNRGIRDLVVTLDPRFQTLSSSGGGVQKSASSNTKAV